MFFAQGGYCLHRHIDLVMRSIGLIAPLSYLFLDIAEAFTSIWYLLQEGVSFIQGAWRSATQRLNLRLDRGEHFLIIAHAYRSLACGDRPADSIHRLLRLP